MTAINTSNSPAPLPDYQGAAVVFDRKLLSRRTLISFTLSILAGVLTLIACVPLFSVLIMLVMHGGARLIKGGLACFTQIPPGPLDTGGGFGNAILGTVVMVGLAALISVPFGILAAIFLAEYGKNSPFATAIRFSAKILTGFPSILAGVFAYAAVVVITRYSALAGGIALSVLMIPIVLLTAEEAIKMVPKKVKDAAAGMGCTQAQVTWKIVVPAAMPGILTGVMLAVARAAGETAPLLFTALASDNNWAIDSTPPYFHLVGQETASLAVFIFNSSSSNIDNILELGWAASLVLVIMVLIFNLGGRLISQYGMEATGMTSRFLRRVMARTLGRANVGDDQLSS